MKKTRFYHRFNEITRINTRTKRKALDFELPVSMADTFNQIHKHTFIHSTNETDFKQNFEICEIFCFWSILL